MIFDGLWGNIWAAFGALGSIAVAGIATWGAFRRPKEYVSGEYYGLPIGVDEPMALCIRLDNTGRNNVPLPDSLRVEFYMDDNYWGEAQAEPRQNNFIPSKFHGYNTIVELPDEQIQQVFNTDGFRVFTWTKAGTLIELKKHIIIQDEPYPIYHISKKA